MKTAVILFNLGGPDQPGAVAPFLFNLFRDPAIITLPNPLRWLVAKLISARRAPVARRIYDQIGGGSPLLGNTGAQALALEAELGPDTKSFIVMRYWHPMSREQSKAVRAWAPDQILLVPLYPQFSSTTTGSSVADWRRAATSIGLRTPTKLLCCYPAEEGFVDAVATLVEAALAGGTGPRPRVLFTAHGLPKKTVTAGDPYQWQVERTVAALVDRLGIEGLDWSICYQSRVGPLEWIGPSTDQEIHRAGSDGVGILLVPVAFVSEHSETLVELDIEYRELAHRLGVPSFGRVPTVSTHGDFIAGLARQIRKLQAADQPLCSGEAGRICPGSFAQCPWKAA